MNEIQTKINVITIKLNENSKPKNYICIENENGILLVDNGLYSLSFIDRNDMESMVHEIVKEYTSNLTIMV